MNDKLLNRFFVIVIISLIIAIGIYIKNVKREDFYDLTNPITSGGQGQTTILSGENVITDDDEDVSIYNLFIKNPKVNQYVFENVETLTSNFLNNTYNKRISSGSGSGVPGNITFKIKVNLKNINNKDISVPSASIYAGDINDINNSIPLSSWNLQFLDITKLTNLNYYYIRIINTTNVFNITSVGTNALLGNFIDNAKNIIESPYKHSTVIEGIEFGNYTPINDIIDVNTAAASASWNYNQQKAAASASWNYNEKQQAIASGSWNYNQAQASEAWNKEQQLQAIASGSWNYNEKINMKKEIKEMTDQLNSLEQKITDTSKSCVQKQADAAASALWGYKEKENAVASQLWNKHQAEASVLWNKRQQAKASASWNYNQHQAQASASWNYNQQQQAKASASWNYNQQQQAIASGSWNYNQQHKVYTFTTANAFGANGPTLDQLSKIYTPDLFSQINMDPKHPGIQLWTVPYTGVYHVILAGASGGNTKADTESAVNGNTTFKGGRGVVVGGKVSLIAGQLLKILVGQKGLSYNGQLYKVGRGGGTGGGGTFLVTDHNQPLLIAGGGGGGGAGGGAGGDNISTTQQIGTGGTITKTTSSDGSIYYIHTFTKSDTFTFNGNPLSAEILVVAGGGAGGGTVDRTGGGGGAGGYQYFTNQTLASGSYSVTVGAGGTSSTGKGGNGSNSQFGTLTASIGGGGGGSSGSPGNTNGSSGGSGGGASHQGSGSNAAGKTGQGTNGGAGIDGANYGSFTAAGGGGAGGVGANNGRLTNSVNAGSGGIGLANSITGTLTYYAGGGGGGMDSNSPLAPGGLGGGGDGGQETSMYTRSDGKSGIPNTGGGGGGSAGVNSIGGAGGSGIVIIKYKMSSTTSVGSSSISLYDATVFTSGNTPPGKNSGTGGTPGYAGTQSSGWSLGKYGASGGAGFRVNAKVIDTDKKLIMTANSFINGGTGSGLSNISGGFGGGGGLGVDLQGNVNTWSAGGGGGYSGGGAGSGYGSTDSWTFVGGGGGGSYYINNEDHSAKLYTNQLYDANNNPITTVSNGYNSGDGFAVIKLMPDETHIPLPSGSASVIPTPIIMPQPSGSASGIPTLLASATPITATVQASIPSAGKFAPGFGAERFTNPTSSSIAQQDLIAKINSVVDYANKFSINNLGSASTSISTIQSSLGNDHNFGGPLWDAYQIALNNWINGMSPGAPRPLPPNMQGAPQGGQGSPMQGAPQGGQGSPNMQGKQGSPNMQGGQGSPMQGGQGSPMQGGQGSPVMQAGPQGAQGSPMQGAQGSPVMQAVPPVGDKSNLANLSSYLLTLKPSSGSASSSQITPYSNNGNAPISIPYDTYNDSTNYYTTNDVSNRSRCIVSILRNALFNTRKLNTIMDIIKAYQYQFNVDMRNKIPDSILNFYITDASNLLNFVQNSNNVNMNSPVKDFYLLVNNYLTKNKILLKEIDYNNGQLAAFNMKCDIDMNSRLWPIVNKFGDKINIPQPSSSQISINGKLINDTTTVQDPDTIDLRSNNTTKNNLYKSQDFCDLEDFEKSPLLDEYCSTSTYADIASMWQYKHFCKNNSNARLNIANQQCKKNNLNI